MLKIKNRPAQTIRPQGHTGKYRVNLWQLFTGILLLQGSLLSFWHSYGEAGRPSLPVACAAGLFGFWAAWGSDTMQRRRNLCLTAWGISVAALLVLSRGGCIIGIGGWINCLIAGWNDAHEAGVLLLSVSCSRQDLQSAAVLLSLLQGELAWVLVRRRRPGSIAVWSLAWVLMLLLTGSFCPPALLLLCGALMGSYAADEEMHTGRPGMVWTVLTVLFFAVGAIYTRGGILPENASFRKGVLGAVASFRYGETLLPEGNLKDAGKLSFGEKEERLLVRSGQIKNLYLKGFTGAVLKESQWESLPEAAYGGENTGMLDWLRETSFDPQTQPAVYYQLCAEEERPEENDLGIRVRKATRRHFYAPSSLKEIYNGTARRNEDLGLQSRGLFGKRHYAEKEYSEALPSELTVARDWVLSPGTPEQEAYCRAEEVYRRFVYEEYTQVSEDLKSFLQMYFWKDYDSESDGIYSAVTQVRKCLAAGAVYDASWNSGNQIPEGENAVRWFLTEEKTGNAALYASAAVLALRAHGIPARYAEGYYVPSELLEKATKEEPYAEVTGQNAHAWAEIYFDGIGWLPVDVTPGYYYDAAVLQQMVIHPGAVRKTAALEDSIFGADEMTEESEGTGSRKESVTRIVYQTSRIFLGLFALVVILATIFHTAAEVRRMVMILQERRLLQKASSKERARLYAEKLRRTLEALGIESALGWNADETDRELSERFLGIGRGEYLRTCGLLEKSIYGAAPLEIYEERTVTSFLEKVLQEGKESGFRARSQLHYRLYHGMAELYHGRRDS